MDTLIYGKLDVSEPGVVLMSGVQHAAVPSSARKMIFLAMHFRKDAKGCPDTERVLATVRASAHQPYFLSLSKGDVWKSGPGHLNHDFKDTILAGVHFKGEGCTAMVDWHFPQVNGPWAKDHYKENWPEKCADLVERGVDIFLMPNIVFLSASGKPDPEITWTEKQMVKDWDKAEKKHPTVRYFPISNVEALHLHPLVKGTRNATAMILKSTRPTSNFETHWKHVQKDRAFFVIYRLRGDETCNDGEKRVRKELGSHNKEPIVSR
jgi:hypothetical protein